MGGVKMTVYTSILSDCERFKLQYLLDYKENFWLKFYDSEFNKIDTWDNDDWLVELFESLTEDTETEQFLELKKECLNWNFNFEETKNILVEMYKKYKEITC